jgi:hypothetical protein
MGGGTSIGGGSGAGGGSGGGPGGFGMLPTGLPSIFCRGRDAGAHSSQCWKASKQERPPCPVSVTQGAAPHRTLGLSIAYEVSIALASFLFG